MFPTACLDMDTHATKLTVPNFCVDVNAIRVLELKSHQSVGDFYASCASSVILYVLSLCG